MPQRYGVMRRAQPRRQGYIAEPFRLGPSLAADEWIQHFQQ